mgnify:CR=1 FL=1
MSENGHEIWFFYISYYTLKKNNDIKEKQYELVNNWEQKQLQKERELLEKENELLKRENELLAAQQKLIEMERLITNENEYIEKQTPTDEITNVNATSSDVDIVIQNYETISIEITEMSIEEYTKLDKNQILDNAKTILQVEAPIQYDLLIKKITAIYGLGNKKDAYTYTESVLKKLKLTKTKQQGVSFCWNIGQVPDDYSNIRVSAERDALHISQQEIKNAIYYTLLKKGSLEKEILVKECSKLFGYKRCGQKIESAMLAGIRYAKTKKIIEQIDGKYSLLKES